MGVFDILYLSELVWKFYHALVGQLDKDQLKAIEADRRIYGT